ncbi:MAG: hypothetical protein U5K74_11480 [Gemmatimonadaceae bacterium]|nr:hypothetical protein [Gemmatimonadaceae bacterium]
MRWIGICERAFDLMCQRAVRRELSPGEPLARRETIQHWVAESRRAEIDAARAGWCCRRPQALEEKRGRVRRA